MNHLESKVAKLKLEKDLTQKRYEDLLRQIKEDNQKMI